MKIHSKARPIFSQLQLPGPLQKHFSQLDIEVDLSNSTNPFLGALANYPDLSQEHLKQHYLKTISSIHQSTIPTLTPLTPKNVLFTVGSGEAIDLILRTFAEPNQDTIALTSPSFMAYEHWGLLHNLRVKKVPLSGDSFQELDIHFIRELNPKLLFLCEPNNPTGTMLNPELIHQLCSSFQGLIVIDEAYIELADRPSRIHDLSSYPNMIILRTLSKAWGLAGIRCGAVIAEETIINTLRYIQVPFGFATPSQEMVLDRCLNPQEMIKSWDMIKKERIKLITHLATLPTIEKVFDSHSNFIFIILKDPLKTLEILKKHKIYVTDCSMSFPNAIKVSISNASDNSKFIEVMEASAKKF